MEGAYRDLLFTLTVCDNTIPLSEETANEGADHSRVARRFPRGGQAVRIVVPDNLHCELKRSMQQIWSKYFSDT